MSNDWASIDPDKALDHLVNVQFNASEVSYSYLISFIRDIEHLKRKYVNQIPALFKPIPKEYE